MVNTSDIKSDKGYDNQTMKVIISALLFGLLIGGTIINIRFYIVTMRTSQCQVKIIETYDTYGVIDGCMLIDR